MAARRETRRKSLPSYRTQLGSPTAVSSASCPRDGPIHVSQLNAESFEFPSYCGESRACFRHGNRAKNERSVFGRDIKVIGFGNLLQRFLGQRHLVF